MSQRLLFLIEVLSCFSRHFIPITLQMKDLTTVTRLVPPAAQGASECRENELHNVRGK